MLRRLLALILRVSLLGDDALAPFNTEEIS